MRSTGSSRHGEFEGNLAVPGNGRQLGWLILREGVVPAKSGSWADFTTHGERHEAFDQDGVARRRIGSEFVPDRRASKRSRLSPLKQRERICRHRTGGCAVQPLSRQRPPSLAALPRLPPPPLLRTLGSRPPLWLAARTSSRLGRLELYFSSSTTGPDTGSVTPIPAPRSSSVSRKESSVATMCGRAAVSASMSVHSPTMQ